MSGHVKRRAASQRYRSLRRRWRAGWRPWISEAWMTVDQAYSDTKVSVTRHRDGRGSVTIEGLDADGQRVSETMDWPGHEARSFAEVVDAYGERVFRPVRRIRMPR